MDKMNGLSLNLEKNNVDKIKELFPEAVEEGKINFDMLRAMLGDEVDDSKEKYQFTWNGKAKSIKLAQTPSSETLRPCKDEKNSKGEPKSKYWDTTENLYIEGDNLEVLKQLQKTYYGKIKMIYIDPPYNTGNDFVYNDSFSDSISNYKEQTNQSSSSNPESTGRFHTNWLNMIYPRLLLSRNLLSDDGVIFISIDDGESDNLRKICNEIFGEDNFVADLTVVNNLKGRNDKKYIARANERLMMYVKSSNFCEHGLALDENVVKEYSLKDKIGKYRLLELRKRGGADTRLERPNMYYPFYVNPSTGEVSLDKNEYYSQVALPVKSNGDDGRWRWGKETAQKRLSELFGKQVGNKFNIYEKDYLESDTGARRVRPKSVLSGASYSTDVSTKEYRAIMGKIDFSNPKSVTLLSDLIIYATHPDEHAIIMDFFSGSSTTAHAVMKSNLEENGNRKFIMVQLPELCDEKSEAYKAGYKNICEIGEERIRRAGEQIKADWEKEHPSDALFDSDEKFTIDIGFKVFKLDSTNVNEWDHNMKLDEEELAMRLGEVFKEDRCKVDILYEIMLKYGVFDKQVEEIDVNGKTMYRVGKRYMIVCLENSITSEDVKAIAELSPKTVIFNEAGFNNDNDKINAVYNLEKAGVEDVKCI